MNKKLLIFALIGAIILGAIIAWNFKKERTLVESQENQGSSSGMILFYGQGCPHCANVDKFLAENKQVEEKVKFDKKEVWSNKDNANLLGEKAQQCGMDTKSIGVPLFWDGSKCTTGDVDIINLLKEKAGIE